MAKTLEEHFGYLSDTVKVERYRAAIQQAVKPGDIVVDLGCGSGLLGLMALNAGAGKVFFIEEGDVIQVARKTIADTGYFEKAEFFQTNSFEFALPEQADVILCDHVGYFGFDYGILALLADAKKRFLKPDGVILPAQIDLKLALVESDVCRKFVAQWHDGSVPDEFAWLGTTSANTKHALQLEKKDLLSEVASLGTLELGSEVAPFLTFSAELDCLREGTLDGVAGWFECRLFDDVHMTNSPTAEGSLDRPQAFLPLELPTAVKKGEHIQVTVMVRPLDHVIAWIVELPDSGLKIAQTTFNGLLLGREALTRAHPDRVALLNEHGRALQVVLSYCDGKRTAAEVQALVQREHPHLFPSEQATLAFVQRTLAWITRE